MSFIYTHMFQYFEKTKHKHMDFFGSIIDFLIYTGAARKCHKKQIPTQKFFVLLHILNFPHKNKMFDTEFFLQHFVGFVTVLITTLRPKFKQCFGYLLKPYLSNVKI